MITDRDIKKLERAFVTKAEFNKTSDEIINSIKEVINMVGEALKKDEEQDDILDDHERRLDRLDDKVFI